MANEKARTEPFLMSWHCLQKSKNVASLTTILTSVTNCANVYVSEIKQK
jgi:hypothetical protein